MDRVAEVESMDQEATKPGTVMTLEVGVKTEWRAVMVVPARMANPGPTLE